MAGASAIQVGTASFVDPRASVMILEGIENFMDSHGLSDIRDIIGVVNR
jgi:dihydroorotate dehydrogenase (NAD+) catalytic subunit